MKTISTLIGLLALAWSAHAQVGPTVTTIVTNPPTRTIIQMEVMTTKVVERKTAPVTWNGTNHWITAERVIKETSVTNAVDRGGRPGRVKP